VHIVEWAERVAAYASDLLPLGLRNIVDFIQALLKVLDLVFFLGNKNNKSFVSCARFLKLRNSTKGMNVDYLQQMTKIGCIIIKKQLSKIYFLNI